MQCPDAVELERFISSELEDGELASMTEHLAACQACAAEVAELQRDLELAASLRRDWTRIDEPEPEPDSIETIGPYRILRKLGQGGMGTVFQAQQENPRRVVALKILRPGIVSESILNRFRHEAQILGRLQHPGIAQIYEAGTHQRPHGAQPYFVMELVHGQPLIAYANSRKLDLHQRLELMAKICDAVEHAHQRGVIHRDLKPDNILVDESGVEPQPKILDFGVARVVDPEGKSTTLHTSAGQIVGTIAYMSPEQASADPSSVDIRSDVYALGVICYELLAARLPYAITKSSIAESVRAIVQDDPTPLVSVDRSLRGDVTTIVGKALEKDKSRRYQSAAEMAADIRRHLRDEPITAHPPSTIYQFRKFARRNRGLVGGVIAAIVILIAGVIGTSVGMLRAQQSALRSQREAQKAQAVNDFLNEMLASANPGSLTATERTKGMHITLAQVLDAATRKLDSGALRLEPQIEVSLRRTLGGTYVTVGGYDEADAHFTRALEIDRQTSGPDSVEAATGYALLASLRHNQGRVADAEPLYRRAYEIRRRAFGEDALPTAEAVLGLAAMARDRGAFAESEALMRKSLQTRRKHLGDANDDVATATFTLASVVEAQGRLSEAEALYRESLATRRQLLGREHPDIARNLNSLANLLQEQGKLDEAEPLFREALVMLTQLLGEKHPRLADSLSGLAAIAHAQQRLDESEQLLRRVLEIHRMTFREPTADDARYLGNLAVVLNAQGKRAEALPLMREAIEINRKLLGNEHPQIATALNNLAGVLRDEKRSAEAEVLFREALDMRLKLLGRRHPDVAMSLYNLSAALRDQGKAGEAEPLLREAIETIEAVLGRTHALTMTLRAGLGSCLLDLRRYSEAEPLLAGARDYFRKNFGDSDQRTIAMTQRLIQCYQESGKADAAAALVGLVPSTQPATAASTRRAGVHK